MDRCTEERCKTLDERLREEANKGKNSTVEIPVVELKCLVLFCRVYLAWVAETGGVPPEECERLVEKWGVN